MAEWDSFFFSFEPYAPSALKATTPAPQTRKIPGLRPDAFCSRTNPSVILREDDFYSKESIQQARAALERFDALMRPPVPNRHYMASAARFKAQQLSRLAAELEASPAVSEVDHMRQAWLVGRIDRALNLCWYASAVD